MTVRLGDRVRIDIPDETDPDFTYHDEHGIVLAIKHTPCPCGWSPMIRVALETDDLAIDMHPWDLRPPLREERYDTQGQLTSRT